MVREWLIGPRVRTLSHTQSKRKIDIKTVFLEYFEEKVSENPCKIMFERYEFNKYVFGIIIVLSSVIISNNICL